jgi:hypothetical protein
MTADADSSDDVDLPRHGAMGELFGGIRAPAALQSPVNEFDTQRGLSQRAAS